MPKYILPWKVGAHRIASIALYRALLSQCRKTTLEPRHKHQIQNVVRNRFKENRFNSSNDQLRVLFKAGYEAIDHLDAAVAGDADKKAYLIELLMQAPTKARRPPPQKPLPPPKKTAHDIPTTPRRSILDRPLPLRELSGRRHIPRLVSANMIPILRIKKPQPQNLSGFITQRIKQRDRRYRRILSLTKEMSDAEHEDAWDEVLREQHGVRKQGQESWTFAAQDSLNEVRRYLGEEMRKNKKMATEMQGIIDQERELAKAERTKRLQLQQKAKARMSKTEHD